uniref:LsmAD domain-containing protein n=1 Tax=Caenorhabditis tropicalis TaxID=1561998 RepID=A0A1I7TME0_9PELO
MSTQTGHPAVNSEVLSVINDMIGRIIRINTTDKKRYSGVLCAVSPDFQFGLKCVVELTKKNENNLLRAEEEVIEKMSFHFTDVVDFAYCTEDDKKNHFVNKFTTDRQYHGEALPDEDLEEWKENEEDDCLGGSIEDDVVTNGSQNIRRNNHNNGWSVNDMFAVNEKMNVVSTFKDDLTQYTTVEVVGTDEDRARADQLAREIESSVHSKFMANLENDDDERDLDKITTQQDFDNGNNQRGGKRNNYNQQPQQRRNQNMTPNGQPVNRRAEGLRGDRRNSGSSSANNSRYNPPVTTQNYQQQPPQQQHGQKSGNYNNRRQNDDYRENGEFLQSTVPLPKQC